MRQLRTEHFEGGGMRIEIDRPLQRLHRGREFALLGLLLPAPVSAQGNIDWEEMWVNVQPTSNQGTFGWMAGQRQYSGLAYDRVRDNLYIVNPAICTIGGVTLGCPKIHIWDPVTGLSRPTGVSLPVRPT